MKTWIVDVPPAKAKRLRDKGVLLVRRVSPGFVGQTDQNRIAIPTGTKIWALSLPDECWPMHLSMGTSGDMFCVSVVYSNESGSRKEQYSLQPRKPNPETEQA